MHPRRLRLETERPCGLGSIDVCLAGYGQCLDTRWVNFEGSKIYHSMFVVIEVKSAAEAWSAGDVLRQLKGYKRNLLREENPKGEENCCEKCVVLSLYAERQITDIEAVLFKLENVVIL
jgi:hypothetical protein